MKVSLDNEILPEWIFTLVGMNCIQKERQCVDQPAPYFMFVEQFEELRSKNLRHLWSDLTLRKRLVCIADPWLLGLHHSLSTIPIHFPFLIFSYLCRKQT